jgi:predicted TIM-barrel fold metal-dependent hydrolase
MIPDFYRDAAVAAGFERPDGMPGIPLWSPELALATMDRLGIGTAILSVSSPGVHFGDDLAARKLARKVNEFAADLRASHPRRFGFFASLPLPDVEGALAELDHAFDTLGADGVVIESNSAGIYPGDPRLDPVFAEMDRRGTVLFIHPTSPNCPCHSSPSNAFAAPTLDFMFESTRVAANLIASRTLDRFQRLRVIIPHAGAALPALADRLAIVGPALNPEYGLQTADVQRGLSRFYYDLAGMPLPRALPALRTFADPARLLYGSDWPFTREAIVGNLFGQLDAALSAETAFRTAVYSGNALDLFPQLRAPA